MLKRLKSWHKKRTYIYYTFIKINWDSGESGLTWTQTKYPYPMNPLLGTFLERYNVKHNHIFIGNFQQMSYVVCLKNWMLLTWE